MLRIFAYRILSFHITLILLFSFVFLASSQTTLEYKNRLDRWEGIKPKPVGGYDIELISFLVDHREEKNVMPNRFRVKFYLHQLSNVYLTVREVDNKHYYWLDKVKPIKPWKIGFDNVFDWSTDDVIRHLNGLGMDDLGVVVRLEESVPRIVEKVAPAILYSSKAPDFIMGYLFTLRSNGDMRATCSIYKEGDSNSLFRRHIRMQRGGRPFTIRWDSTDQTEGFYKLEVRGFFLDTNDHVEQIVSFYHQPSIK
jgi:hypothetical protein